MLGKTFSQRLAQFINLNQIMWPSSTYKVYLYNIHVLLMMPVPCLKHLSLILFQLFLFQMLH